MDTPPDTSRIEEPRRDGRAADLEAPGRWSRTLRAVGVGAALLVAAACTSPFGVEETAGSGSHTTSSGNHTTSSGNVTVRGG